MYETSLAERDVESERRNRVTSGRITVATAG